MKVHNKINMKVLFNFSKSTSKQLNLVADYIIKNKTKFLVGTVGSGLLIDDLLDKVLEEIDASFEEFAKDYVIVMG